MGLAMPSPVLIGNTYYLRIRTPSDVLPKIMGKVISVPVDGEPRRVLVKDFVKVSLHTKDRQEAKRRFTAAYAALQDYWEAQRRGEQKLSHKQLVAIAGKIRNAFVADFEENPGPPERWERVLVENMAAKVGRLNPLTIPTERRRYRDLETRFGAITDAILMGNGIVLNPDQRPKLLELIADGLTEAALVSLRRAQGDYSPDTGAAKYPEIELPKKGSEPSQAIPSSSRNNPLTFTTVIDEEVRRRSLGRDAVPMRAATERKYRAAAHEFAAFRKSEDITTVTAREANAWKEAMLERGELSNATVAQRIQNLRTVIEWARDQQLGELFPHKNPIDFVSLPEGRPVSSADRTFTLAEARQTLLAARKEKAPELRWLPWMCAYSGARINEVAQLTPEDFFQVGDDWFYRLTTKGGKTLKTAGSERRVPVHPLLVKEGFIDFVQQAPKGKRLFPERSQPNLSEWLRKKVGITRPELAPNHGWRHLFEDLCLVGGVLDAARNYITGRRTGNSGEGYGKSDAMLPGLANEMKKVKGILSQDASRA